MWYLRSCVCVVQLEHCHWHWHEKDTDSDSDSEPPSQAASASESESESRETKFSNSKLITARFPFEPAFVCVWQIQLEREVHVPSQQSFERESFKLRDYYVVVVL